MSPVDFLPLHKAFLNIPNPISQCLMSNYYVSDTFLGTLQFDKKERKGKINRNLKPMLPHFKTRPSIHPIAMYSHLAA